MFRSIFREKNIGPYPKSLVEAATERAVEDTDPCLRGIAGYRGKLHPKVLKSLNYVAALVGGLGEPIHVDGATFSRDSRLKILFTSAEQMTRVLQQDPSLKAFRAEKPAFMPSC